MTYPIPPEAFDDRLGVIATSGAGKTYAVLGAMARLHKMKARSIAFDALGVMYGIRLMPDGSPSPFKPVIFGGPHGDLPLSVGAAALIGETCATMSESVIIDLSQLGSKAAERRFMLAFLTALEKHHNKEPVHLLFDEADLWAPQRLLDKEGEAAKLLGRMDNVVRRGRVKGFIPWLITQRPAVLSKDVLSMVDGMIFMKMTGPQDRDAAWGWIEGQADKAKGKEILNLLPTLDRGEAVIWIPGRQVMKTAKFPENSTFDSSRTPKRGEARRQVDMKPLDLGKLKDRLAAVEAEAKANDPVALKAQLATALADLAKVQKATPAAPNMEDKRAALDAAKNLGRLEGARAGHAHGFETGYELGHRDGYGQGLHGFKLALQGVDNLIPVYACPPCPKVPKMPQDVVAVTATPEMMKDLAADPRIDHLFADAKPRWSRSGAVVPGLDVKGPQAQLLGVLAWWERMGKPTPSRAMACAVAGWKVTSGHIKNVASSLKTAGLVDYPEDGKLALTEAGRAAAPPPPATGIVEGLKAVMDGPQVQVLDLLLQERRAMTREEICAAMSPPWAPTSGHIKNVLSSMKTLEVVTYPEKGSAALADWVK